MQQGRTLEGDALQRGAAWLAGLHAGVYGGLDDLARQWRCERTFLPTLSRDEAAAKMTRWEHAVRQTVAA